MSKLIGKQVGSNGRAPTPNADGSVSASVGVFKVDHIAASHGRRTEKDSTGKRLDPSAAQVAWWHEFGTSPKRGKGITGKNFISNAFNTTVAAQEKAFNDQFLLGASKLLKGK